MNKYFKQFQKDGVIASYGDIKGKYQLTERGLAIIEKMQELEEELKEVE